MKSNFLAITQLRAIACGLFASGFFHPGLAHAQDQAEIPARMVLKIPGAFLSHALSRDGKWLAVGQTNGHIKVFDAVTGNMLVQFFDPQRSKVQGKWYDARIESVAFNPDGDQLVSTAQTCVSAPTLVRVWDLEDTESKMSGKGPKSRNQKNIAGLKMSLAGHNGMVRSACFSPDGSRIASGASRQKDPIIVWDAATGKEVTRLVDHRTGLMWKIAYTPDGSRLVTSCGGGDLIQSFEFAPDGGSLKGKPEADIKLSSHVRAFSLHPNKGQIAVARKDFNNIQILDFGNGKEVAELTGHTAGVWDVAYNGGGSRLAGSSLDGPVKVWDTSSGKCLSTIMSPDGLVHYRKLAWSPDGNRLYIVDCQNVTVWELVDAPSAQSTESATSEGVRTNRH